MRVGITGHRGLSPEVEQQVRVALADAVTAYGTAELVGVSCVADGPDSWFAQTVLDHGGDIEVVLPAEQYRAALPDWHLPTYDTLVERAAEVHRTGLEVCDDHAYMTGSEVLVDRVDELIAVWDGNPARGHGGTADVVSYARRQGVPVRVFWPSGAARD
jgi:hypothetical protein